MHLRKKAQPLFIQPKPVRMGHQVKTIYKQAEACYDVSGLPCACVVTLLHYAGLQHNRPPARIIVTDTPAPGTFTDDIHSAIKAPAQLQHTKDPLFPNKTARTSYVDHVV